MACRHVSPLLLFIAVSALWIALGSAASFVTLSGNQLLLDGKPFYHVGFNAVWMPSSAAYGNHQRIDDTLDAAQRIGLKVLRLWGFNSGVPYEPGRYDDKKATGLDYVIAGAAKRGLRVELALANFWPAYHGPEKWLMMAEGDTEGLTVADFYRNAKVLVLLQQHIKWLTSRVNTYTSVTFRDDPTILGYNIFNEARCPGCTADDVAARNSFISALADTVRAEAPKQLTFSGTEGFFAAGDPNVGYNPGAGTQCEGEDWTHEIKLFDVASVHVYWRQMESLRQTDWKKPGFEFYIQYLHHKLKLYTELAEQAGKVGSSRLAVHLILVRPLVIEEFGLTKRFFTLNETKVVVAVVADALIAAKRAGKPLMGAWIWQAAPIGESDFGGYDVPVTKTLSNATIGLGNPPMALGTTKSPADLALTDDRWQGGFQDGGAEDRTSPCDTGTDSATTALNTTTALRHASAGAAIAAINNTSTRSRGASSFASGAPPSATAASSRVGSMPQPATPASRVVGSTFSVLPAETAASSVGPGAPPASHAYANLFNAIHGGGAHSELVNSDRQAGNGNSSSSTRRAVVGRRMLGNNVVVKSSDDALDYFRQGDKRRDCSKAVKDWPEKEIPFVLDVQAYYDMVKNHEIVDILAEAAHLLSEPSQAHVAAGVHFAG